MRKFRYVFGSYRIAKFDKFLDLNKEDDYNIHLIANFIQDSYDLIDTLTFYVSDASFITKESVNLKNLSKNAFVGENKKNDENQRECCVCFE